MRPTDPKVSIIIPVLHLKRPKNKRYFYAKRYTLREVLDDLHANVRIAHEIIVICNGSDRALIEFVQEHAMIDKHCLNSTNVGVARSWNMGAQMAEGEALCYLNDDVQVGPGAMEKLFDHLFASDTTGIVGPKGARWKGAQHDKYVGENTIEEADAIAGFMFMVKSELYRQLGGFDVNYTPAGLEEIDFCFFLRSAGKKCLVIPQLDVRHRHQHGVSAANVMIDYLGKTTRANDLHVKNKAYFKKKWNIGNV